MGETDAGMMTLDRVAHESSWALREEAILGKKRYIDKRDASAYSVNTRNLLSMCAVLGAAYPSRPFAKPAATITEGFIPASTL
jgi:hypothetical protein